GLRAEVLDDDLLDVAVPAMEVADREERLRAFGFRLPDADEDPGRERDREPPRVLDRSQSHPGVLVRRPEVGTAPLREPAGGALEHQPHRRGDVLEARHLLPAHDAGIEMWQQAGLL